jgi:hypothetical protein
LEGRIQSHSTTTTTPRPNKVQTATKKSSTADIGKRKTCLTKDLKRKKKKKKTTTKKTTGKTIAAGIR